MHAMVLILLFLATNAQASTPQSLEDLDAYLAHKNVSEEFELNQTVILEMKSCVFIGACDTFQSRQAVTMSDFHQVELVSFNSSGGKTNIQKLTRERWDLFKGNMVRIYVDQLSQSGFQTKVTLKSPVNVYLTVNSQEAKISGIPVLVEAQNSLGQKSSRLMVVNNTLRGLGQILWWKNKSSVGEDTVTVLEYLIAN